jgi:hypothetical protein
MSRMRIAILGLIVVSSACLDAQSRCSIAVAITIHNIEYRTMSPIPDAIRIDNQIRRTNYILGRCSTDLPQVHFESCNAVQHVLTAQTNSVSSAVDRITKCHLSKSTAMTDMRLEGKQIIESALSEQANSDGEASYWISDDLLALFMIGPKETLKVVADSPVGSTKFVAALGSLSLEDVDDDPGRDSQQGAMRKKSVRSVVKELQAEHWGNTTERELLPKILLAAQ